MSHLIKQNDNYFHSKWSQVVNFFSGWGKSPDPTAWTDVDHLGYIIVSSIPKVIYLAFVSLNPSSIRPSTLKNADA